MIHLTCKKTAPERRARLVIADDHEATRVLLRTVVGLHPEIEVVGEAENGEEAARRAVSGEADIALLDIEMPRMDGLAAAELIRSVRPQTRVILHTASADGMPSFGPGSRKRGDEALKALALSRLTACCEGRKDQRFQATFAPDARWLERTSRLLLSSRSREFGAGGGGDGRGS